MVLLTSGKLGGASFEIYSALQVLRLSNTGPNERREMGEEVHRFTTSPLKDGLDQNNHDISFFFFCHVFSF